MSSQATQASCNAELDGGVESRGREKKISLGKKMVIWLEKVVGHFFAKDDLL